MFRLVEFKCFSVDFLFFVGGEGVSWTQKVSICVLESVIASFQAVYEIGIKVVFLHKTELSVAEVIPWIFMEPSVTVLKIHVEQLNTNKQEWP